MHSKGPAGMVIKTVAGQELRRYREAKTLAIAGSGLQLLKELRPLTEAEMVQQLLLGRIMTEMQELP